MASHGMGLYRWYGMAWHGMALQEGVIKEGTRAAEGMPATDMEKRKRLQREKLMKLRSPNFAVSLTRLAVHNVPREIDEKQLKQVFVDAVKARAKKQKPHVKQ
ncbi:unnamed protein product, partial [Closterium sp. NIES-54]